MTESEWLACDEPAAMLRRLECWNAGTGDPDVRSHPVYHSDRKLRLFACACCRQVWHLLTDERSRIAVESWETWADAGKPGNYWKTTGDAGGASDARQRVHGESGWAHDRRTGHPEVLAAIAAHNLGWDEANQQSSVPEVMQDTISAGADAATVSAILREIVGNPLRPVTLPFTFVGCDFCDHRGRVKSTKGVCTCPRCNGLGKYSIGCPWLTPLAMSLAEATYADSDWGRLPILADALEDAGCPDGPLLRHLRAEELCPKCGGSGVVVSHPEGVPFSQTLAETDDCDTCHGNGWIALRGPHVLGCWALDLILGRT